MVTYALTEVGVGTMPALGLVAPKWLGSDPILTQDQWLGRA